MYTNEENRKLVGKNQGPFKVLRVIGNNLVELDLPVRRHKIVNVDKLKRVEPEEENNLGSEADPLNEERIGETEVPEEDPFEDADDAEREEDQETPDEDDPWYTPDQSESSNSSEGGMPPPQIPRKSTRIRVRPKWHGDYITTDSELSD